MVENKDVFANTLKKLQMEFTGLKIKCYMLAMQHSRTCKEIGIMVTLSHIWLDFATCSCDFIKI